MELEENITLAQHLPGKTNDNYQSILHQAIQQPDLKLGNSLITSVEFHQPLQCKGLEI
jgi:hypothetical protein